MLAKQNRKKLIKELLKSEEIKQIYDSYIIKDIEFKVWVTSTVDYLLKVRDSKTWSPVSKTSV